MQVLPVKNFNFYNNNSLILNTIISWYYFNFSLANEYVGDVTIPTQVVKYNQNVLQTNQPIRLQHSYQFKLLLSALEIPTAKLLLTCGLSQKYGTLNDFVWAFLNNRLVKKKMLPEWLEPDRKKFTVF
jgi:hypothetical protein